LLAVEGTNPSVVWAKSRHSMDAFLSAGSASGKAVVSETV
jgi:hypothetical protein